MCLVLCIFHNNILSIYLSPDLRRNQSPWYCRLLVSFRETREDARDTTTMGWKKKANLAQYSGGNWDNFVKKVGNLTAEEAMRIAFADSNITFFFFCRQGIVLDHDPAVKYGPFNAGDAVFFTGVPWYGSAPQCDSYEKTAVSTIYISPCDNRQFQEIGDYVLADGAPAIDVVCIFGGNYATNVIPMLRANNNDPPTDEPFNSNIQSVLSSVLVKSLQAKGRYLF